MHTLLLHKNTLSDFNSPKINLLSPENFYRINIYTLKNMNFKDLVKN